MLTLVCLILLVILSVSIVVFSLYYGITPMPASRKAREGILTLIPDPKAVIFELGSGWGHLACSLAHRFPAATIYAFEGSPVPWFVSLLAKWIFFKTNLRIKRKNFYHLSLQEADGVVCYLYPGAMEKLKEKFKKELKPGSFVISYCFSIPGWTADQEIELDDLSGSRLYYYRMRGA